MNEIEKIAAKLVQAHPNLEIFWGGYPMHGMTIEALVRFVLETAREPTTDMMNAGTRALAVDWNISCDGRIAPDLWQVMIDELLK